MTRQAVHEFVDSRLQKYPVVVFSKSYCPYCHKAKAALDSFKPRFNRDAYEWVEIDGREDMDEIQDYMKELTGGR
jgi:glutaredoxin 3